MTFSAPSRFTSGGPAPGLARAWPVLAFTVVVLVATAALPTSISAARDPAPATPPAAPSVEPPKVAAVGPVPAPPAPGTFTWVDDTSAATPPATWPCAPIPYTVVTENAPPGGEALIAEVVASIEDSTSGWIRFSRQPDRARWVSERPVAGIAIGWGETKYDWGGESVSGLGGPESSGTIYSSGFARVRGGGQYVPRADDTARTVITHEVGHALGLGHTPAGVDSIMSPGNYRLTSLAGNDIAVLDWAGYQACAKAGKNKP